MTPIIEIEHFSLRYADGTESLRDINLAIEENAITTLFGPGGGGKSTLLRALNRLNDLTQVAQVSGRILIHGEDILSPQTNVVELRRRVAIVFARPITLPLTIYQNVSYGLELAGIRSRSRLDSEVESALRQAELWEEVYDRLGDPANSISGGQQQRLCLARSLALKPEVILLDEPTSALDPIATAKIESSLQVLKQTYTIIIAPHNTQQSARVADYGAFFLQGELVEYGPRNEIFVQPKDQRTLDYIEGRFG
ncbi:MAG TPA: phosphate ABC transporter ATP-binding protein [Anaerolineaceae bacterium]